MSITEMNRATSDAVRAELTSVGSGRSGLERGQRRTRAITLTAGAAVLAVATMGAAIVVNNLPGTTTVGAVGTLVSGSGVGSGLLDLGPAPSGADAVIIDLTCLSPSGTVEVATTPGTGSVAASAQADCALTQSAMHVTDGLLPTSGTSIEVTATPGTKWSATARYATTSISEWGVNANGQTYGVPNANGVPDLEAAQATNGRQGYISSDEMMHFTGSGTIPVYESDGVTVIGEFPIGDS